LGLYWFRLQAQS